MKQCSFGHLDFGHLILSFDSAQDGEPVEPFRISDFEIRIFYQQSGAREPICGVASGPNFLAPNPQSSLIPC